MASMDLGRLDLVSTTSGLRLDLSSRAEFTTPAGNLTNECRATPPSDEEGWGRCWIERANNFRLVLGLRLGDGLQMETKDNVLATLADRIGHAEVSRGIIVRPEVFTNIYSTSFGSNYVFRRPLWRPRQAMQLD